ncbi:nucleoside-diphosphate kinase [Candidatus Saganbacteria bacterium]|nr:nucleoside-diphosphate kinase [Candidatus Saganbacteria bacterium]
MVKPDAVSRGLVPEVEKRISVSGLHIIEGKQVNISLEKAKTLYAVHVGKSFYDGLLKFITSGPAYVMKIQGENAVLHLRSIMGATDPRSAESGTIRGDLKEENIFTEYGTMKNIIHGSDSVGNAKYELSIFFS